MADSLIVQVVIAKKSQVETMRQLLNPKQFRQGVYQAVKRTTNAAKKIIRDIVQERTYLNDKYAKRVIKSRVATGANDITTGHVEISQELVPLIGYLTSTTKTGGAVAMVSKNRPVIRLRHAFQVRVRSESQKAQGFAGHVGIMLRTRHLPTKGPRMGKGKITSRGFAARLAIAEQFGPSVLQLVAERDVTAEAITKLGNRLEKEMAGQISRFLKRQPPQATEAA